jgi:hypothetical protein
MGRSPRSSASLDAVGVSWPPSPIPASGICIDMTSDWRPSTTGEHTQSVPHSGSPSRGTHCLSRPLTSIDLCLPMSNWFSDMDFDSRVSSSRLLLEAYPRPTCAPLATRGSWLSALERSNSHRPAGSRVSRARKPPRSMSISRKDERGMPSYTLSIQEHRYPRPML